jgi:N-acetylmuramoyl-L-alanine amidase
MIWGEGGPVKSILKRSWFPAAVIVALAAAGVFLILNDGVREDTALKTSAGQSALTVIVDAGHGGADGGAVSLSGVEESAINLDIAARLDTILGFFGTRVIMTRTTEELDYSGNADTIREKKVEDQKRRLNLINTTENAVLLSIHQNTFPTGGPFGAQVLYAPTTGSKDFAVIMQQLLKSALNSQSRRTAAQAPDSILLMNHITCPALLIECGFLSNGAEEKLLMTDAYRLKVAAVIAAGYLCNKETLNDITSGGTNEIKDSILLH